MLLAIAPMAGWLETWLPFTKSASVMPLYVAARCVQALTGSDAVPRRSWSELLNTCADGRWLSVLP